MCANHSPALIVLNGRGWLLLNNNCIQRSKLCCAEKEKRAAAVALKMEEERKAGENARLAKAEQHRAVQQHQKQAAQEVTYTSPPLAYSLVMQLRQCKL